MIKLHNVIWILHTAVSTRLIFSFSYEKLELLSPGLSAVQVIVLIGEIMIPLSLELGISIPIGHRLNYRHGEVAQPARAPHS